jgi:hypothetical protein
MPNSYKILGQIYPTSNTLTNVYVSSASSNTIVSSITICNQDTTSGNVDIVLRPIDESLDDKHFILKDYTVEPFNTNFINLNITMEGDVILAANVTLTPLASKTANISFGAFGVEIT